MNKRTGLMVLIVAITLVGSMRFVTADPVDQNIDLVAGWNAVFLEVEPTDTDPAVVFASLGVDVESVWAWNANAGSVDSVEFIQNPTQPIPATPQMLTYQPSNPMVTNLSGIHGNQAYLIKMSDPITGTTTLTVNGEPKVPHKNWKQNSFNFVGFHVDGATPTSAPFYHAFFDSSSAHNGSFVGRETPEIYRLDNSVPDEPNWVEVTDGGLRMKKGEAFWIYTHGSSNFNGPVAVQLEQTGGLHYGDALTTQDVVFKNDSGDDQQLISLSLSGAPANLQLFYWHLNGSNTFEWAPFPPANRDIAPGESERLTLGVKRAGLTAADFLKANIDVTDSAGTTFQIPLSVDGIDFAGLWVGQATVNKVNEVQAGDTPTATGSEFSFRIIIHVADNVDPNNGEINLLSQVIQMYHEVDKKMVLFTDDALILNPEFSGSTMRDGKPVGRRISAPGFHNFNQSPLAPIGNFGTQGGALTATLNLPPNDPTNPFNHLYHPDHLVENGTFNIDRSITITFDDVDEDDNNIVGSSGLGWGSSDMGGVYEETITGLNDSELKIKGTFLLHRVSKTGSLQ